MLNNCQVNNFVIKEQVGSGAYGLVFIATDLLTDRQYAIKAVIKQSHVARQQHIKPDDEMQQSNILMTQLYHYFKTFQNKLFLPSIDLESIKNLSSDQLNKDVPHYREIALQLKVQDHNNIVKIHQVLESPLTTFIIMDYYPIDLFTSIVEKQHFIHDPLLVKKVFLQLCSALLHCHKLGIFHCDIKPENILLDNHDNAYLCDFGLATTSVELAPNVCVGSSYYMAPERIMYVHNKQPSSTDSDAESMHSHTSTETFPTATGDIWSLGIILINLTCIRNPWSKAHQHEDKTFSYYVNDNTVLLKILPISQEFFNLITKILKINPYDRIDLPSLMTEVSALRTFTTSGPFAKCDPIVFHQEEPTTTQSLQQPQETTQSFSAQSSPSGELLEKQFQNNLHINTMKNSMFDDLINKTPTPTPITIESRHLHFQKF